jgi:DMSO/TMAO reductase YedYZ molybdopterin-dependent catalytic subunit
MTTLLEVRGLVREPQSFDFQRLSALPGQVPDVGALLPQAPTGRGAVRLASVLEAAGPLPGAVHLALESSDGSFSASIPLEPVVARGLIVYRDGAHPLTKDKGGPVRFFIMDAASCGVAGIDRCANVKDLRRIVLSAAPSRDTRPTTPAQHQAIHPRHA